MRRLRGAGDEFDGRGHGGVPAVGGVDGGVRNMSMSLPLFPLNTVLFPGCILDLQIFEARYLDMIGRCMKQGGGFGVVCILEGRKSVSRRQGFAMVGCEARDHRFSAAGQRPAGDSGRGRATVQRVDAPKSSATS